jgi:hypothetical protein
MENLAEGLYSGNAVAVVNVEIWRTRGLGGGGGDAGNGAVVGAANYAGSEDWVVVLVV